MEKCLMQQNWMSVPNMSRQMSDLKNNIVNLPKWEFIEGLVFLIVLQENDM